MFVHRHWSVPFLPHPSWSTFLCWGGVQCLHLGVRKQEWVEVFLEGSAAPPCFFLACSASPHPVGGWGGVPFTQEHLLELWITSFIPIPWGRSSGVRGLEVNSWSEVTAGLTTCLAKVISFPGICFLGREREGVPFLHPQANYEYWSRGNFEMLEVASCLLQSFGEAAPLVWWHKVDPTSTSCPKAIPSPRLPVSLSLLYAIELTVLKVTQPICFFFWRLLWHL